MILSSPSPTGPEGMSSNFNLFQLNFWIGLVRGDPALPRSLYDMGYRDKAVERAFPNSQMEQVCPELIIASRSTRHAIALEFKSGPNTEADQLRRYADIESTDLRRAYLDSAECETHDITIIGRIQHQDRLRIGIEGDAHPFPLLLVQDEGIGLDLNEFVIEDVTRVFDPLLEVEWDTAPTSYFLFDQDSNPWEIAEAVMPAVFTKMLRREPRVEFQQICQELTPWGILGPPGRQQLVARVSQVMSEACSAEFDGIMSHDGSGVRIVSNPLEIGASRRTAAYQRLGRLQKDLIDRLSSGQLELPFTG